MSDEERREIPPELIRLMQRCAKNTGVFAQTFFPTRFYLPFSKLHKQVIDLLDDPRKQMVAIAAPRGIGKTSLVNFAYVMKHLMFGTKKMIVPICQALEMALQRTEPLRRHIIGNKELQKFFEPLKRNPSVDFSKDFWLLDNGAAVYPRGAKQALRGTGHEETRPDLIVLDDIEDPEQVNNPTYRADLKRWLYETVLNAVNRDRSDWKVVFIGTILHEDSLLANTLEDSAWDSIRLELCDENWKSNWPEFMPTEKIKRMAEDFRRRGMLDSFYREYRNLPIATEDQQFTQDMFRTYDEGELLKTAGRALENFVIVDPAKTESLTADFSAILGAGVDCQHQRIYVRDLIRRRMNPMDILNEAFAMCERLKARTLGYEVTSLHEFASYPIRNEIIKRGLIINLVELKATQDKQARITSALTPFYRQGHVYHNPAVCGPLEEELLCHPRSRYDDCKDALAHLVLMLDEMNRFFMPEQDENADPELEYRELEEEDREEEPLVGWRTI